VFYLYLVDRGVSQPLISGLTPDLTPNAPDCDAAKPTASDTCSRRSTVGRQQSHRWRANVPRRRLTAARSAWLVEPPRTLAARGQP
jgi:hypothetical protein